MIINPTESTKQELIEYLTLILENVELPQHVTDIVNYTLEGYARNKRNVTKADLTDTISDIETATKKTLSDLVTMITGDEEPVKEEKPQAKKVIEPKADKPKIEKKVIEPKAENKPKIEKKVEKKVEVVDKDSLVTKIPIEKEPKKAKKSTVTHELVNTELLKTFPQTIVTKELQGKMQLRMDLKTIDDVALAFNNGEDLVLAFYWTKRHLKQYADSYDAMEINPNPPTSFENDLDLVEMTFANELLITGVSLFSYVPYVVKPKDLHIHEDDNNLRFANGCEFQIYEVIGTSEETE